MKLEIHFNGQARTRQEDVLDVLAYLDASRKVMSRALQSLHPLYVPMTEEV